MFQLFYDWCVLGPARVVDALIIIPFGFAPIAAAYFTWHWLVDDYAWRTRLALFTGKFVAAAITVYVLAVTTIARIPACHAPDGCSLVKQVFP